MTILEVKEVVKSFNGITALNNVCVGWFLVSCHFISRLDASDFWIHSYLVVCWGIFEIIVEKVSQQDIIFSYIIILMGIVIIANYIALYLFKKSQVI